MAEPNREEAERASRRAEEHFLAGNVAAACQLSGKARCLFPSLPGVANAAAAYAVHAAAPDWHAVLGVDRPATADAVKRQFRRLSLLVHPDKNSSAAAEDAFKLLHQAYDALSSGAAHATEAAAAAPAKPPAPKNPQPPPPPANNPHRPRSYRRAAPGVARLAIIRCDHCMTAREYGPAVRCRRCRSAGWYYLERTLPPLGNMKNKSPTLRCPGRCPRCETKFTSMVYVGSWLIQCKNCLKDTLVHVKGPDDATCTCVEMHADILR